MELVSLLLMPIFFLVLCGVAIYAYLYRRELRRSKEYIAVSPPKRIITLLSLAFYVSLIMLFMIAGYIFWRLG
jgi:hypothetical protein